MPLDEVVDMWEGGRHAAGEWRISGRDLQRVDPDRAKRDAGETRHLFGEDAWVTAIPTVAHDDDDRAAPHAAHAPRVVERAQAFSEACSAAPVGNLCCGAGQRAIRVALERRLQEAGSIVWSDGSCVGYARDADPDAFEANFRRDVDYCSGAFLMLKRALFRDLGGFDENIFLFYEDDDLCRRIADAGRALVHVHGAVALHGRGASSAPEPGRVRRSRWHQAWSRSYVSRKYGLPDPTGAMLAKNGVKALLAALAFRRSGIERYGGSVAGAWAARRGRSALAREGLEEEPAARPDGASW